MLLAGMSGTGRRCRRTRLRTSARDFWRLALKSKFLAGIIKRACPTTPHLIGMAAAARSFHGIPEATGEVVPDNPQRCVWALAGCIAWRMCPATIPSGISCVENLTPPRSAESPSPFFPAAALDFSRSSELRGHGQVRNRARLRPACHRAVRPLEEGTASSALHSAVRLTSTPRARATPAP